VGASREIPFDARLVCATNRDLTAEVAEGRFREDLLYRIKVVHLEVPPLRARGGDVLLLAQHFIEKYAARFKAPIKGMSRSVAGRLVRHDWPGNVRELENCIERAVALARHELLGLADLPASLKEPERPLTGLRIDDPAHLETMEAVEKRYILHVLDVVDDNKSAAAEILGLDRKTLYRKLRRYAEDG
jgi:two-component system response regulator HydG